MNEDMLKGQWKQLKGKARQHWGKLTDDDIERIAGNRQELEGRLQERYGYAKEDAKAEVERWMQERH